MTARFDAAEAEGVVWRYFGVLGQASELGGERTQNFRIRTPEGLAFTLKVSDPQESPDGTLLESAALRHIEHAAMDVAAPRVLPALNGESSVFLGIEDGRHLRLLTYIEGTPFAFIDTPTRMLRRAVGEAVASLDAALESFVHPYLRQRDLIWDVKNIARLRPFLALIDEDRRPLVEAMLDRFETVAGPHMAALPAQAVHSDMNGQNILVASEAKDRLSGFLDFGDLVYAPRLVDLAGAALLQVQGGENDLRNACDVVEAYHRVLPLKDLEISLLPEFMIARCVINVVVTELLATRDPANRSYIMKNNPVSWMRLERLSALPQNPFRNTL